MSAVSTHVLNTTTGEPAAGVLVRLERVGVGELGRAVTDQDGRVTDFGGVALAEGTYRLVFETGPYLSGLGVTALAAGDGVAGGGPAGGGRVAGGGGAAGGEPPFFPEVVVTFQADGRRPRYHVPLLLSPYSYATYRGS